MPPDIDMPTREDKQRIDVIKMMGNHGTSGVVLIWEDYTTTWIEIGSGRPFPAKLFLSRGDCTGCDLALYVQISGR